MLSHGTLMKLAEMIGVSESHGICYGAVGLWMNALFKNDKATFDTRLETLADELARPQQLALKIATVRKKVKNKEKISENERKLIDIEAFLQGQKAILDAYLPGGISGNNAIKQTDLVSKLKLFTDFQSIACVHQLTRVFTKTRLKNYLAELTLIIERAQRETGKPYPLMLNANGHGIGLRYDNDSGTWVLFDVNALGEENPHAEINGLTMEKLIDEIFWCCDGAFQNQGFLIAGIQVVGYEQQDLRETLDVLAANQSIQPYHHWVKDFEKKTLVECALSNNDNIDLNGDLERLAPILTAIEEGNEAHFNELLEQLKEMELSEEDVVAILIKSIAYKRDTWIAKIMLLSQEPRGLFYNPFVSYAVYLRGDLNCLNKILGLDIDSRFLDAEGRRVIVLALLNTAVQANARMLVRELAERLDNVALVSAEFEKCLSYAAEVHPEILAVLLEQLKNNGLTLDVDKKNKLLKEGFVGGHLGVVQQLVDIGADLNFKDQAQFNALTMAIRYGKEDMVRWVFKKFKADKSNIDYLTAILQPTLYGLNALDYAKLYCRDVEFAMIQKDTVTAYQKLSKIELKEALVLGAAEIKLVDAARRYDKFQQDTPLKTTTAILANYVKGNALGRFFSGHWNRTSVHLEIVASTLRDRRCNSPQKIIEKILDDIYQQNNQQDDPLMSIKKQTSSLHRRLNYLCMEVGLVFEKCIQAAETSGRLRSSQELDHIRITCV